MSHKKRLIENISSLFVLQAANYVLPMVTIPYLVRVLGPDKFGLIAFAQAFIQYFIILSDYGFNLSATRQIAIHRDDPTAISDIFSAVMSVKLGLMLIGFVVMSVIVLLIPRFHANMALYHILFLTVLSNVLFPIWLFQGMERMKYVTVLSLIARSISLIAIFLFVHKESDYLLAAAAQPAGLALSGVLALFSIKRLTRLHLNIPSRQSLRKALDEGWHVFLSTAAISLYTTSSAFILGLIAGNTAVGYFSGADKICKAIQGLFSPISQAIYPHISNLVSKSKEDALAFIRKSLKWIGIGSLMASIALFAFASPLVVLILGDKFLPAVNILRCMAFLPFIVALSNVFGMQTMLTFGMNKAFSKIIIISGLINLILIVPLTCKFGAEGTAISVLITEIIVTVSMGAALQKSGFHLFRLRKSSW